MSRLATAPTHSVTTATARRTLNRAFAELNQAQGDPEKIRQAAEKGWRAAREAVYAVLGEAAPLRGTANVGALSDYEANVLGRPRGGSGGQPLADGYGHAMQVLHGECFYQGSFPKDLVGELTLVGALITQAERDTGRVAGTRRRRRRQLGD